MGEPSSGVRAESEIPLPQRDEGGCLSLRSSSTKIKSSLNYSEYKNCPLRSENWAWLDEQEG